MEGRERWGRAVWGWGEWGWGGWEWEPGELPVRTVAGGHWGFACIRSPMRIWRAPRTPPCLKTRYDSTTLPTLNPLGQSLPVACSWLSCICARDRSHHHQHRPVKYVLSKPLARLTTGLHIARSLICACPVPLLVFVGGVAMCLLACVHLAAPPIIGGAPAQRSDGGGVPVVGARGAAGVLPAPLCAAPRGHLSLHPSPGGPRAAGFGCASWSARCRTPWGGSACPCSSPPPRLPGAAAARAQQRTLPPPALALTLLGASQGTTRYSSTVRLPTSALLIQAQLICTECRSGPHCDGCAWARTRSHCELCVPAGHAGRTWPCSPFSGGGEGHAPLPGVRGRSRDEARAPSSGRAAWAHTLCWRTHSSAAQLG